MNKCKIEKWFGSWYCQTHGQKITEVSVDSKTTPLFCYWGAEDTIIDLSLRIAELEKDRGPALDTTDASKLRERYGAKS